MHTYFCKIKRARVGLAVDHHKHNDVIQYSCCCLVFRYYWAVQIKTILWGGQKWSAALVYFALTHSCRPRLLDFVCMQMSLSRPIIFAMSNSLVIHLFLSSYTHNIKGGGVEYHLISQIMLVLQPHKWECFFFYTNKPIVF